MNAVRFARAKLESARFRLHNATRIKTTCAIDGVLIKVEAGNPAELYRIERYRTREPETVRWIADYVKPGQVFYDVGANIGLYSIFAAKRLSGQVQVYSFEPESQNYASLNKNVYLNGLSESITTLCLALSDSSCISRFYVRGHLRAGGAIHQFGEPVDHTGAPFVPVHQQGMIGVSLDDLCFVYGMPVPTHIKVDVDGHEMAVIQGCGKLLHDARLESVLLEITQTPSNEDSVREIFSRFDKAGFAVLNKSEVTLWSSDPTTYNAIFVRPDNQAR